MKTVLSWDLDFCSYKSIFVLLLLLNVEVLQWRSFIGCFSLSNSHLKWTLFVWEKRIVSKNLYVIYRKVFICGRGHYWF